MRIVFMGTPGFAVPCLARLIADGHELVGIFTQPDKPKGRGYHLAPPPVKELALAHALPCYQPATLRSGEALDILRGLAPDLAVVVAYGKILPKALLDCPRLGCVNVHGSLLPKYRGAAPIQWSVINGDELAGVTTMYMVEGLDTGDIILSRSTPIGENETSGELYERLALLGAQALSETVSLISRGEAPRVPQDDARACYAPMLEKPLARIDFQKPARQVRSLICGMNPWPVAHTLLDGKALKVYRAGLVPGVSAEAAAPGTVLDGKRLVVACADGAVELLELQAEGGKRMLAADYLRGHPVAKGARLG